MRSGAVPDLIEGDDVAVNRSRARVEALGEDVRKHLRESIVSRDLTTDGVYLADEIEVAVDDERRGEVCAGVS